MKEYEISIQNEHGSPTIHFANNTDRFVEVVFTVNGKELKTGKKYSGKERGFCYPGHYAKDIKAMPINMTIDSDSEIQAYVYRGSGKYKEIDIDLLPPFIRRRIGGGIIPENKKAIFRRLSDTPSLILSLKGK